MHMCLWASISLSVSFGEYQRDSLFIVWVSISEYTKRWTEGFMIWNIHLKRGWVGGVILIKNTHQIRLCTSYTIEYMCISGQKYFVTLQNGYLILKVVFLMQQVPQCFLYILNASHLETYQIQIRAIPTEKNSQTFLRYIYIYIYMCVCVCVCVYIYIYIYIQCITLWVHPAHFCRYLSISLHGITLTKWRI